MVMNPPVPVLAMKVSKLSLGSDFNSVALWPENKREECVL